MYPLWIALMRFLFNLSLRRQVGGGVSATILLRPITRNSNKIVVQGLTAVSDYSSNEIGVADGSNVLPFSVALDTESFLPPAILDLRLVAHRPLDRDRSLNRRSPKQQLDYSQLN